jgi:hypothetical protein
MMPQDQPVVCFRCATAEPATDGPLDGLCRACRGEVGANRADARDELVRHFYDRDTIALAAYPADIRLSPLGGQS